MLGKKFPQKAKIKIQCFKSKFISAGAPKVRALLPYQIDHREYLDCHTPFQNLQPVTLFFRRHP
jgi:hypothetical protein